MMKNLKEDIEKSIEDFPILAEYGQVYCHSKLDHIQLR